jgi:glucose/arabinose dehydrogenase
MEEMAATHGRNFNFHSPDPLNKRKRGANWKLALMAGAVLAAGCLAASAATLPGGFSESVVASGLSSPTAMAFAPDGRLFVCEQGGALRVIKNGTLLSTPFLTVNTDPAGERGLLGVTFDPNFANNQWVYIYYTVPGSPPHNRVSRFTAAGDVAVSGSQTIILELNNLSSAQNHNGGALDFGLDGKLYIAVGENANSANAQTLANLLGKILRIEPSGAIPTDNPFYNSAIGVNRAIWALGLRNPFTFGIQPGTGRMFINDVGQGTWEEIDEGLPGANYGWPNCEGDCSSPNPNFNDPIYQYSHANGCAIVGGAFYNPAISQFPSQYAGVYFFADLCGGWIRTLDPDNGNQVATFATGLSSPVALRVSSDGFLYYLDRGRSSVYRVQYASAPSITQHPQNQTVPVGGSATFTVVASGAQPLSYQWQRDTIDIPGATASAYTRTGVQLQDNGVMFRCRVSNAFGSTTSNPAQLTVSDNQSPVVTIVAPSNDYYNAGDTIGFSGSASDPEDGSLPPSRLSWTIVFHHDVHTHPFLGPIDGVSSGTFTIPDAGETSANVFYRIHLTATDSEGATSSTFVDVLPNVVTLTVLSDPNLTGLQLTLDGQPFDTPFTALSVVGMTRTLGAPTSQRVAKRNYSFLSWSDGGGQTHVIRTPAVDTSYTAFYRTKGRR